MIDPEALRKAVVAHENSDPDYRRYHTDERNNIRMMAALEAYEAAKATPPTRAEIAQVEPVAADYGSLDNPATYHMSPPPAQGLDATTVTDVMLDAAARAVPGLSNEHYRKIMMVALKGGEHD